MKGMRLAYLALELNAKEPLGLRCLSDLFDNEGTEILSAIVLEYALAPSTGLPEPVWRELDDLRFLAKWSWKFSRHKTGNPHLSGEAFKVRSDFEVDEDKYQAWLADFLGSDTLNEGFKRAHTFAGAVCGLLIPKDSSTVMGAVYTVSAEQFIQGPEHALWLKTDTSEFDALESARQEKARPKRGKSKWKFW